MVIHKIKSEEVIGYQQIQMVYDCIYQWSRFNNTYNSYYFDIMNMKTSRFNLKHGCYVALTYHFKPNKW